MCTYWRRLVSLISHICFSGFAGGVYDDKIMSSFCTDDIVIASWIHIFFFLIWYIFRGTSSMTIYICIFYRHSIWQARAFNRWRVKLSTKFKLEPYKVTSIRWLFWLLTEADWFYWSPTSFIAVLFVLTGNCILFWF